MRFLYRIIFSVTASPINLITICPPIFLQVGCVWNSKILPANILFHGFLVLFHWLVLGLFSNLLYLLLVCVLYSCILVWSSFHCRIYWLLSRHSFSGFLIKVLVIDLSFQFYYHCCSSNSIFFFLFYTSLILVAVLCHVALSIIYSKNQLYIELRTNNCGLKEREDLLLPVYAKVILPFL